MPTVTLGRKRPSEAIVDSATAPKNKKIKFTDDGNAVVVPSTNNTTKDAKSNSRNVTSVSKVKPDYSKFTHKDKEKDRKREKSPQKNGTLVTNTPDKHDASGRSMGSSSLLVSDDLDFPRGGGSSFTPLEHKELRAEAIKEAENEILKDMSEKVLSSKKRLRNGKPKVDAFAVSDHTKKKRAKGEDSDTIRVEYLTYKKLLPSTRVLAQVITTTPLSVIVSLPHQMIGHIPLDRISRGLNDAMDRLAEDHSSSSSKEESIDGDIPVDEEKAINAIPTLEEIFHPGQYLRAIVTAVHPQGVTMPPPSNISANAINLGKPKNELDKASRRVELSIIPHELNQDITTKDLVKGFTLPASISSLEDHGYVLDIGVSGVSGFLSFKDAEKGSQPGGTISQPKRMKAGSVLEVSVKKLEASGRICAVSTGKVAIDSEITDLTSKESIQPGQLVRALITSSSSSGLNVQFLGLFTGTIHPLHIPTNAADIESQYRVGKKTTARILWELAETEPRQFALSVLGHIIHLRPKEVEHGGEELEDNAKFDSNSVPMQEMYPIGMILDNAKVTKVESDRGLHLHVADGLEGVVHISEVSDDHVPSLSSSSGPYKIGSTHRARVTGYYPLDGTLQCSMKESILEKKWLRVNDVTVGDIIKGTIVNLTDRGLFVSISGSVHAVVWPNHFADVRLSRPERKFRTGSSIKCRVLLVDPEKNRVSLTAKKTLIESTLPIISSMEDARPGALAHAVVYKILDKVLLVEFYNGVRGIVPLSEATDTPVRTLEGLFNIGQVLKVRVIEVKSEDRILVTSVLKADVTDFVTPEDFAKLEIGHNVSGHITDIHKDNVVLKLQPSHIHALLSLNNIANHRGVSVAQIRSSLKIGEEIDNLMVVSKNPSKNLAFVAITPKKKPKAVLNNPSLTIESLAQGQILTGIVVKHSRKGSVIRLGKRVLGTLHPTDAADDYASGVAFPAVDAVVRTVVLEIDVASHQVILSTRPSKLGSKSKIVDPEVLRIQDLKPGQTVRGFVKSVIDHGLFISLSRTLDARVQIKELFDEFVKDWKPRFEVNQVVQGRILSIDLESNRVELSFRSGELKRGGSMLTLSDFEKGQIVDGVVKKVEDYGVFIQIKDTKISGLCHKSELVDGSGPTAAETLQLLHEGDSVRALILSVDTDKKRISFGLKPSYFYTEDLDDSDTEDEEEELDIQIGDANFDVKMDDQQDSEASSEDEDHISLDLNNNGQSGSSMLEAAEAGPVSELPISIPLKWNAVADVEANSVASSEDSEDEDDDPVRKKRKKRHQIEQDRTIDLHTRTPQSTADFERMLLGSPNSSYLWLQFMAFQLQLSEIEKAREVGRRALKAINFREDQERLNVWIALLNLEIMYGTEVTLDTIFKEAARANDSKTIHWRLAVLLDDSQKPERAEEQYRKTCKKFGTSSKIWTKFAEHYFRRSLPDEARKLLPRSLLSLEKRKHLKTISKFAQLEYHMGSPERGRTIFEGIIDTHRKRLDLWNIYIDMEAAHKNIQGIRAICERAIALKLSKKKAKFFFKKWLELEKKLGDDAGVETVKRKAVEWTQNAAKEEEVE